MRRRRVAVVRAVRAHERRTEEDERVRGARDVRCWARVVRGRLLLRCRRASAAAKGHRVIIVDIPRVHLEAAEMRLRFRLEAGGRDGELVRKAVATRARLPVIDVWADAVAGRGGGRGGRAHGAGEARGDKRQAARLDFHFVVVVVVDVVFVHRLVRGEVLRDRIRKVEPRARVVGPWICFRLRGPINERWHVVVVFPIAIVHRRHGHPRRQWRRRVGGSKEPRVSAHRAPPS